MAKNIFISDLPIRENQTVTLVAWVNNIRDLGKIVFIELKDSTGLVQVVTDKATCHLEDIVEVTGVVKSRELKSKEFNTIPFEITANNIKVLTKAEVPPFPLFTPGIDIDSALRLKYRYLDLRRPRMLHMLRVRHQLIKNIREFLYQKNFQEIETPLLSKTTPEGARDFVVPSSHQKGKFYALPQSPQQYKQLLMIAGVERYFQLAKCLRDEDLRADRAFEHTQLDLEVSHVSEEDIYSLIEEMWVYLADKLNLKLKQVPFPRITYDEAIKKYSADKFDLRSEEEKKQNVLAFCYVTEFPLFEKKDDGSLTFSHNPFTAPHPDDLDLLQKGEYDKVRSRQYDLVCNGFEVASGSIRMNEGQIMKNVFKVMGYNNEQIEDNFGHLIKAYEFGSPIHGGIGMGIERPLMIILNETSLGEVIAFPQSYQGNTAVMDAPSNISNEILKDLGLALIPTNNENNKN